jgi:hypothetical protein
MTNVDNAEAKPEGQSGLMAFFWLLAAGATGAVCAFLPLAQFISLH